MKIHALLMNVLLMFISTINSTNQFTQQITTRGVFEAFDTILNMVAKQEKGAYFCFSTSDLDVGPDLKLNRELQETFAINHSNVLKAMSLDCKYAADYEPVIFMKGDEEFLLDGEAVQLTRRIPNLEIQEMYSDLASSVISIDQNDRCVRFLKNMRAVVPLIFVGDERISENERQALFGKRHIVISTPIDHGYGSLDSIEKSVIEAAAGIKGYKIIAIAMGVAGKVLQKRLWNSLDDVFLFDFESFVDKITKCNTRSRSSSLHNFNPDNFIMRLERPDIKILCTAALIDLDFERRKQEYCRGLNTVKSYGYNYFLVEACKPGDTFLDDLTRNVHYWNANDYRLRNKGVNEIRSMLSAINYFHFSDDDMIVKLTGRYNFLNDSFLKTVEQNPDCEGFVLVAQNKNIITGCFGLRCKYFKDFLNTVDLTAMERDYVIIETAFAHYIQKIEENGVKIMHVPKLNLEVRMFGDNGTYPPYID